MIFNSAAGQGHHSKLASAACAVFKMETAPVQPTSISVRTWGGYFLYDASSPSLPVSVSTLSCRPHKFVYFCRHRAYLPDFDCSPDVVKCKSELMLDLSLGPWLSLRGRKWSTVTRRPCRLGCQSGTYPGPRDQRLGGQCSQSTKRTEQRWINIT